MFTFWKKVWLINSFHGIVKIHMAIRLKNKKRIALVLSGGGVKAAAFHIGVCLALQEKGFQFVGGSKETVLRAYPNDQSKTIRIYVGSSAGAFVAAILSAGYSLEALINAFDMGSGQKPHFKENLGIQLDSIGYRSLFDLNTKGFIYMLPRAITAKNLGPGGIESLLKEKLRINGFFTTKSIEKYLRIKALSHNEFRQLGVNLFIVATQLNYPRKAIFGNFPEVVTTDRLKYVNYATISEAVAASTSLPPVYSPYGIKRPDGKIIHYYDGEIRDTLSTHVAADNGADLVISSYSVQPYQYTEEIGSLDKFGIPVTMNQALYQVIQQKIDRHIGHLKDIKAIYSSIDGYFKQNNLPDQHREKVLEIIRQRVHYKPEVDYIYIHPLGQNHEMFFADHFSLNPKTLERIVKIGFRSALTALRNYDF